MNRKLIIHISILWLSILFAFGQEHNYTNFTVDHGLPSNSVYCSLMDTSGFMWFGTDAGVCRYDGENFKVYTRKDGLAANSTLRMHLDKTGKIWFSANGGKLSYFENDKIAEFEPKAYQLQTTANNYVETLISDNDSNLWIIPYVGNILKYSKDEELTKPILYTEKYKDYNFCFTEIDGQAVIQLINHYQKNKKITEPAIEFQDSICYVNLPIYSNSWKKRYIIKSDTNNYFVAFHNFLLHIKDFEISDYIEFENSITGLVIDSDNSLWVSTLYTGHFIFNNANLKSKPKRELTNMIVPPVTQDFENGYWLPSGSRGIYYFSGFTFNTYTEEFDSEIISDFDANDEFLVLNTHKQTVYKCDYLNDKILNTQIFKYKKGSWLKDILIDKNNNIWLSGSADMVYDVSQNPIASDNYDNYDMHQTDSSVIITCLGGFIELQDYRVKTMLDSNFNEYVSSIYADKNGTYWMGTLNGLHKYDGKNFYFLGDSNAVCNYRINEIAGINSLLFCGTNGNGLICKNSDTTFVIEQKKGLVSNQIRTIYIENDSIVWLGTNGGISVIAFHNFSKAQFSAESYTKADGLPSNKINKIKKVGAYFWAATDNGLLSFDKNEIQKQQYPQHFYIENIKINRRDTAISNKYNLANDENNIDITLNSISYKAPNKTSYKYSVTNNNSEKEIYISQKTLFLQDLQAGDYYLCIKASDYNGVWNKNNPEIKLHIHINKSPFQTLTFYFVIAIGLLLIVFVVLYLSNLNKKKKAELREKISQAEHSSFLSQLNQHFIFNAFNSIRGILYANDIEKADHFITTFAKFLRLLFDNVQKPNVLLDEEISLVRHYLELESLRFKNSFDFEINIPKEINPMLFEIPPLVLHPFIENALWHGLLPKENDRFLLIDFCLEKNNLLCCKIIDNGIGQEKALELLKKKSIHTLNSLANIKERIKHINKLYRTNIHFTCTNLHPELENKGTEVIVYIPIKKTDC